MTPTRPGSILSILPILSEGLCRGSSPRRRRAGEQDEQEMQDDPNRAACWISSPSRKSPALVSRARLFCFCLPRPPKGEHALVASVWAERRSGPRLYSRPMWDSASRP